MTIRKLTVFFKRPAVALFQPRPRVKTKAMRGRRSLSESDWTCIKADPALDFTVGMTSGAVHLLMVERGLKCKWTLEAAP